MVHHGPGLIPFGFHLFWFLGLIAIAGLVILVLWAIRASTRPAYPGATPPVQMAARETPLEILARRFAAGEITAEDYERGRDLLGGGGKT